MVGAIKRGVANPTANPSPHPDQGIKESSGTGVAEGALGNVCGVRPQVGACTTYLDKNKF